MHASRRSQGVTTAAFATADVFVAVSAPPRPAPAGGIGTVPSAVAAAAAAVVAVAASKTVSNGDIRTVGWGGEVTGGSTAWACRRAI